MIAAGVGIVLLLVIAFVVMSRGGSKQPQAATAGQVPSVTVVVPGRSQVGRVVTASGPLGARRDQPVVIAHSKLKMVVTLTIHLSSFTIMRLDLRSAV